MPTSFDDRPHREEARRLLARALVVHNACDLDLLVFLHRHPRTVLTSEQLAEFVGYNLKEIAKALDVFIEAGLVERTAQQSAHAARMFHLQLDGPQGGGVKALLELASTRQGRRQLLDVLNAQGSGPEQDGAVSKLKLVRWA